jgi:hypothetical protein
LRGTHLLRLLFDPTPNCIESFPFYDVSGVSGVEINEPQVAQGWTVRPPKVSG